ncbi:hypothetical protein [Microcella frigidaquae]|uniref:DUF8094 domain-containing protein n=1 Tax=Microcella frigidaquae TaxID=424758 RepID=A0A840X7Y5_9MICO|nr:hypothetical protein [Microcella frigidaquae]MBB5617314.1 hypothetical protein [Microcella frigidaquae]NHN45210.1 hypothetical protein [Microcella frigidaquae]
MRFIAAIVFFVVAVVGVGLGVAQRTVWAPPDRVTADLVIESPAPVTIITGEALNAYEGRQTFAVQGGVTAAPLPEPEPSETPVLGESPAPSADPDAPMETTAISAAYGRSSDVMAWVGDAAHNLVTWDAENGVFVTETIAGTETTVPEPFGGDLWYGDFQGEGTLGFTVNVPDDVAVLIVSDGTLPAPQAFSITWPLDSSTPFSTVLILIGVGALVIGLLLLLWALIHMRRQRGPRRKSPKMPKVPKPSRYRPISARPLLGRRPKGRRAAGRIALVPTLLIGGLLLTACTGGSAVIVSSPTPVPTDVVETPETAVTENQLSRIITRVGQTVAQADGELSSAIAETRLAGPALALRTASYTVKDDESDYPLLPEFPTESVVLALPERLPAEGDTWPRRVFAIVRAPATVDDEGVETQAPPLAMVLVQEDPRSQYKVHYAVTVTLPEDAPRPEVAPAELGAPLLPPNTPLLAVTPEAVAAAYSDVLLNGDESESYPLFQTEGDPLLAQIGAAAKAERQADLPDSARLSFSNAIGEAEIFSFVTTDGGALVMAYLLESETVRPTEAGAAVNAPDSVAALAGRSQSTTGIRATYGIQVLFSVPAVGIEGPVVMLGYTQGLIAAREVD